MRPLTNIVKFDGIEKLVEEANKASGCEVVYKPHPMQYEEMSFSDCCDAHEEGYRPSDYPNLGCLYVEGQQSLEKWWDKFDELRSSHGSL